MSKKFRKVFQKLLEKTDSGELEWNLASHDEEDLANERHITTGPVYTTRYKSRVLILAAAKKEKRTQAGPGLPNQTRITADMTTLSGLFEGTNSLLIVKNPRTGGLRRFSNYKILDDLLESVREQNSNVDEWAEDILDEDE